jgi:hypothetical protein
MIGVAVFSVSTLRTFSSSREGAKAATGSPEPKIFA